jgi:SMC interacting uncharacterized protein involved in chromosome segregation
MEPREELEKLLDALATQRDELIVKAHLGRLEAEDEWRELEDKLAQLRIKAEKVADTAGEVGRDVAAAAEQVGKEIARGYEKLLKLF